jgi:serpin B
MNASEATNGFATSLYKELGQPNDNIFFSPYSVATALGAVGEGAKGVTADELRNALPFGKVSRENLGALYKTLNSVSSVSLANALWLYEAYHLFPEYEAIVRDIYFSEIQKVDFKNNPEGTRDLVNVWVLEKTRDKIKELIPTDGVNPLTRLIVANAIYFKDAWKTEFDKDKTRDGKFFLPGGKSIDVPMMYAKKREVGFWETKEFKVLQMPYRGGDVDMTLVLPNDEYDRAAVESNLPSIIQNQNFQEPYPNKVNIWLPRFKIETEYRMIPALKKLGINQVFSDHSDLSGLTPDDNYLKIGGVFHKAFVDVNEEGTEAAAATAVMVMRCLSIEYTPEFRADHPFFFFIRHSSSNTILFMGKIVNPIG